MADLETQLSAEGLVQGQSSDESDFLQAVKGNKELPSMLSDDPIQVIGQSFNVGVEQVKGSYATVNLLADFNHLSDEDELTQLRTIHDNTAKLRNEAAYKTLPWYAKATADAASMLPGIVATIGEGAAGAIPGAGVGAGIGSVGAGAGALPGAIAGAGWGFRIGAGHAVATQTMGEAYQDLRLSGVPRQTARSLAVAAGTANAALEFVGLKALGGLAGRAMNGFEKKSLDAILNNQNSKKVIGNIFARAGLDIGKTSIQEGITEAGQQLNIELSKFVAEMIHKTSPEAYGTRAQAWANVQDSFVTALGASLVLGTIGGSINYGTGRLITKTDKATVDLQQKVLAKLEGMQPEDILRTINEGMQKLPDNWDRDSNGQAFPEGKVEYDEKGRPYISAGAISTAEKPGIVVRQGQLKLADIIKAPQKIVDEGLAAIYPIEEELSPEEVQGRLSKTALFRPFTDQEVTGAEPSKQLRLPIQEVRPLNPTEIKARQNQISSDIKTMRKEESRLENEILLKEKTGQNTLKLVDKWRKVSYAIDAMQSESDLIGEGLATPYQQNANFGKVRMKKLASIFDKITTQANKIQRQQEQIVSGKLKVEISFEEGKVSGSRKTRREISRMQADLKNLVDITTEHMDDKTARQEIRTKLKTNINKVTTAKGVEKASIAIKEQALKLEQQYLDKVLSDHRKKVFNDVVKQLQSAKVREQAGRLVSSVVDAETSRKVEMLRYFLSKKKHVGEWMEKYKEQYGDVDDLNTIPDQVLEVLTLANMADKLYSGDPLSVNVTSGTIAQWIADGKDIISQRKLERAALKANWLQQAKNDIGITGPVSQFPILSTGQQLQKFGAIIKSPWLTFNSLLDHIDPSQQLSSSLDKTKVEQDYYTKHSNMHHNFMDIIMEGVSDLIPQKDILQKFHDLENERVRITHINTNGQTVTEEFSRAQLISFLNAIKDPSSHKNLTEGNKWRLDGDNSFGRIVNETLSDADKALSSSLLDFYKDILPSINEIYKAKNGIDLPQRENYSPRIIQGQEEVSPYSTKATSLWPVMPNSSKTRKDNSKPIILQNPFQQAERYMDAWSHYDSHYDYSDRLNTIFNDPDIRMHLNNEFGSSITRMIDKYRETFVQTSPIPRSEFWDTVRGLQSSYWLGFRTLTSGLTNLSSGTLLWAEQNPVDLVKGIAQSVLHPIQTEQALRKAPLLERRWKGGPGLDVQLAMSRGGLPGAKLIAWLTGDSGVNRTKAITDLMFAGIRVSDAASARIFGGPLYWAEKSAGKSEAQAITTVDRLMNQTQQGITPDQIPDMFRNPVLNATLLPFTQQPVQMAGRVSVYMNAFFNSPSPSELAKLGYRLGMAWLVPGFLLGMARTMPSWLYPPDEDETGQRERNQVAELVGNTLLGPFGGLPIVGQILEAIWFRAAKEVIGSESKLFRGGTFFDDVYQDFNKVIKTIEKANELETNLDKFYEPEEEDEIRIKRDLAVLGLGSKVFGVPKELVDAPIGFVDRITDSDPIGAGMAIGGYTSSRLNSRKRADEDLITQWEDLDQPEKPYDTLKNMVTDWAYPPKTKKTGPSKEELLRLLAE